MWVRGPVEGICLGVCLDKYFFFFWCVAIGKIFFACRVGCSLWWIRSCLVVPLRVRLMLLCTVFFFGIDVVMYVYVSAEGWCCLNLTWRVNFFFFTNFFVFWAGTCTLILPLKWFKTSVVFPYRKGRFGNLGWTKILPNLRNY